MPEADASQIYRDLMRFKPEGLTANAWAVKAGVSRTVWADMRRHGNPSRRTLEKLLATAGSSLAEFEALRVGTQTRAAPSVTGAVAEGTPRGWNPAPLQPLPLFASVPAGEWGGTGGGIELLEIHRDRIADRLPRPASLASDSGAYAISVVGDSMWPRYRPGRRVAVSPRSPVAIGDDVLVIVDRKTSSGGELAMLKEFVRRASSGLELRQFNPDITFSIGASEVRAIHRVAGELI